MFNLFEVAWGLRNDTEYGADPDTQRMIRLAKAERAIRRLQRAIDTLPWHERSPFSDPIEDILFKNASTQERWVTDTETYLPKALLQIKKHEKMRNHSHGFYGTECTPRESCRSSQAHPLSCMHLSFHQPGTA
jgi:hypothetical protein